MIYIIQAYSAWKGKAISPDEILDLYQGICMNNLDNYSHVLTGTSMTLRISNCLNHLFPNCRLRE